MEKLVYVDRRNTNCNKWDGQQKMFGEEGLHAMWVADMDFRVPECVVSALREYVESGVYGYYKIPDAYYQAFIDWEREHHGYEVKKEWIRFSPGVVAGFHWLLQILTEENDAVIVNTPVYYPFLDAVKNNHRNLICSDLKNENGEYSIDFDDFEKKITDHQVKLFILCSPHNPAGRVWKKEELKQLFGELKKKEQEHYKTISGMLNGDVPSCDCNDTAGKDYKPEGHYSKSEASEDKTNDCFLATDCIGTEKLVSGEYNTNVFACCASDIRKVLADIQIEEQNHAEMLYKYKMANGMQ